MGAATTITKVQLDAETRSGSKVDFIITLANGQRHYLLGMSECQMRLPSGQPLSVDRETCLQALEGCAKLGVAVQVWEDEPAMFRKRVVVDKFEGATLIFEGASASL